MNKLLITAALLASSGLVQAKLPALDDAAKAKAAEAAAKTAWQGKVDGYLLCKSQDKVAASYYKSAKAAGKDTKAATPTPACADPGQFVYAPPDQKPPQAAAGGQAVPTAAPAAAAVPAKKS